MTENRWRQVRLDETHIQPPLHMKCLYVIISTNMIRGSLQHGIDSILNVVDEAHSLSYQVWKKCNCVLDFTIFIVGGKIESLMCSLSNDYSCDTQCQDEAQDITRCHQCWHSSEYVFLEFARAQEMIADLQRVGGDDLEQRLRQMKAELEQ